MANYRVRLNGREACSSKENLHRPMARIKRWLTYRGLRKMGLSAVDARSAGLVIHLAGRPKTDVNPYELAIFAPRAWNLRLAGSWCMVMLIAAFSFLGLLTRPAQASDQAVRTSGPQRAAAWEVASAFPMLPTDCPPTLALTDCGWAQTDAALASPGEISSLATAGQLLAQGHSNAPGAHSNFYAPHSNAPWSNIVNPAVHGNLPGWSNAGHSNQVPHTNVVPGEYIY